jgi:hypothetical protein
MNSKDGRKLNEMIRRLPQIPIAYMEIRHLGDLVKALRSIDLINMSDYFTATNELDKKLIVTKELELRGDSTITKIRQLELNQKPMQVLGRGWYEVCNN